MLSTADGASATNCKIGLRWARLRPIACYRTAADFVCGLRRYESADFAW